MSVNYGLTYRDLLEVKKKLSKQKNYLEQNKFLSSSGQEKTLLDVSYSANLSKRYYPRILNKVNTFISHAFDKDLTPVFLTITLDGFFRDFLKGDYSRWDENRADYIKHIPNNDRSGYYLDYIDKKKHSLTPRDLYKILGHQMFRFLRSSTLQRIRKDGYDYTMIRVTEPHKKDGVPHFHVLMHLPKQYIPSVYLEFQKFFPAPQNHKPVSGREPKYIAPGMYETEGFQTEIRNAASYILKYILKSFVNLIEGNEVDYLQAWYVHNRIPRIITTHTLIPQDIYHSVAPLDDDWYYLTNIKFDAYYERDRDNDYFKFDDGQNRKIIGDSGLIMIVNNGRIVASYGSKKFSPKKIRLRSLTFTAYKPDSFDLLQRFIFYIPPNPYSYYISKVYDDGTMFVIGSPDDFFLSSASDTLDDLALLDCPDSFAFKPVNKMSNFELYQHYLDFDFDLYNPARYAFVHNELIYRSLIIDSFLNPNEFNTRFYDD